MTIYLDRGPFLTIPDKLHPGQYKVIRNPDWHGELPEIVSFTDFLKWNYTLEYGQYIRKLHCYRRLPLPWGVQCDADIETVIIEEGRYDRIDHDSFDMYVICDVVFEMNGCRQCQKYIVHGFYCSYGGSDFLCGAELYNGQFIRLNNPLDEFLVPILSRKDFESIAQEIFDGFYPYKSNYPGCINTFVIARFMGLDIKYARLSKNGKVKSKLILDKRDTTVYDKDSKATKMKVDGPTILVDESLEEEEAQNAIIHECVHAYLHNLFYELQSYYRKMVGRKMPEFNDYFYSKTQRSCLKWMETQANAIPRFIQMPEEQASDVILNFFEKLPGEPDWDDYRELIDLVKWKFGVSRNAAKRRIIELGWSEVRGVYVYNTTGYVEDYDVELRFPQDYTYTLSFRQISDVFASCETFAELVRSKKFIYLDGHVVINSDRYIRKEHGLAMGLTEYARHHMAECCLDFKRIYAEFDYSYTYGELHKDDLTEITAENRSFSDEQRKKIRMAMYEITEENDKLTVPSDVNEFGKAVRFHMERCGLTSDLVADRSGMGVNTVNKMRSGKKVKLETVLAFCVALELEESFRIDLMQKAKVDYDMSNPAHRLYVTIFELMEKPNVFQINELLKAEGFTPWTRDCEEKKRYAKKSM